MIPILRKVNRMEENINKGGEEPIVNQASEERGRRRFSIIVDDDRFNLDHSTVTGLELMTLVKKRPCRYALVQVIPHADDQFIDPDEEVDLSKPGVERFVTVQKDKVTIYINGDPYEFASGSHSVADILGLVGESPDGYDLLEEKNGPPLPIPTTEPVCIEGCEIFHTQVKSGGSS